MAEIINLRKARKEHDRALRARDAAENRAKSGRSKTERTREQHEQVKLRETLDHAKRDDRERK